jgi:hypothetical protein
MLRNIKYSIQIHNPFKKNYFTEDLYNYKMYFKKTNILFIDVPKCACSTLKNILIRNEKNIPSAIKLKFGHPNWSKIWPEFVINDENAASKINKLAIIRNPYKRIVSAYLNIYSKTEDKSFEDFILSLPILMADKLSNYRNNHYRPCSYFINIPNVNVFRLEDFHEVKSYLQKHHVSSLLFDDTKKINRSNYDDKPEFFFNEPMLNIVNEIYKKDFILGQYEVKEKPFSIR